jgi:PEP-CTERM motif
MLHRTILLAQLALLAPGAAFATTIVGNGGNVSVPDGSIPLPPSGNTTVQYVSTYQGISGVGANPDGSSSNPTNGSTYTTSTFSPGNGGSLNFAFDYISSDGTSGGNSYPDNAWVDLVDTNTSHITELFSSTTTSTPLSGGTTASVLGPGSDGGFTGSSGDCYGPGCGNTGWQTQTYNFSDGDTYYVEFGVVNSIDVNFQSALYVDSLEENGRSLTGAPEPATLAVLGAGLIGLAGARRARRSR